MRSIKHIVIGLLLAAIALTPAMAAAQSLVNTGSGGGQPTDVLQATAKGGVVDQLTGKTVDPGSTQDDTGCTVSKLFTQCVANMVYYIGPGLASWVLGWAAYFFDFSIRITLNSTSYALDFLNFGWNLALSFANMFFIFLLVYAALVIMLRADMVGMSRMLAWVVAIALIVNFSFFFTRVAIDAGNILAVQFYNVVAFGPQINSADPNSPPDLTRGIMQAVGVDQLFSPDSFSKVQQALGTNSGMSTMIVLTVLYLSMAVIFWVIAISLAMAAVKFFMRTIGLWFVLVASPVAFVAQTLSSTRHLFRMWLSSLIGFSFYPAVFLFMFYILTRFLASITGGNFIGTVRSGLTAGAGINAVSNGNFSPLVAAIANVSIRMVFIVVMMYIMLKVADWLMEQAGGFANGVMSWGSAVVLGGGFRTAANIGAFAGRNLGGRLAYRAADTLNAKGLNTGIVGGTLWRGANALSRSNFDLRNTRAGSALSTGLTSLTGANAGRGGEKSFSGSVAARSKAVLERAEGMKASAAEARNEQKKFEKGNRDRVAQLQNQVEQARLRGDKKMEKDAADELRTIEAQTKGAGERIAKENAKQRITEFAQRIGGRNLGNLGLPSYGSLKGAAAAMDLTKEKKKKEAAPAATTPAPAATKAAPAAPEAPKPANEQGKGLKDTERIERLLERLIHLTEKNKEAQKESGQHIVTALHALPTVIERSGKNLKEDIEKKIAAQAPAPAPGSTITFTPTDEWQEVPQGAVLPAGLQIRMDQQTGKSYARYFPQAAE